MKYFLRLLLALLLGLVMVIPSAADSDEYMDLCTRYYYYLNGKPVGSSSGYSQQYSPIGYVDTSKLLNAYTSYYSPAGVSYLTQTASYRVDSVDCTKSSYNDGHYAYYDVIIYHSTVKYTVTQTYSGFVPAGATTLPAASYYSAGTTLIGYEVSCPGYLFTGWTSSDVTINSNTFTMPSKNVTLYGSWSPSTNTHYNIEFYKED